MAEAEDFAAETETRRVRGVLSGRRRPGGGDREGRPRRHAALAASRPCAAARSLLLIGSTHATSQTDCTPGRAGLVGYLCILAPERLSRTRPTRCRRVVTEVKRQSRETGLEKEGFTGKSLGIHSRPEHVEVGGSLAFPKRGRRVALLSGSFRII